MNVYVIKLSSIILTKKHITKQTNWNQHKENCNAKNCDWKQGKYLDTKRMPLSSSTVLHLVHTPGPLFLKYFDLYIFRMGQKLNLLN